MRLLILLLLFNLNSFGQTKLPSSGPLSMSNIALVMYNLGQITLGEKNAPYSISFLNGKSTLSDKTAPYSISDWYGYGTGTAYFFGSYGYAIPSDIAIYKCFPFLSKPIYSPSSSLSVGVFTYTDNTLTVPNDAGSYVSGAVGYIVTGSAGQITSTFTCP